MELKGWKEKLLTISIAVVLVLFIGYSINTFLDGEHYDEEYNRYLFIIAGVSGIIAILIGAFIKVESVGAGLIGGGILSILYGVIRYWEFSKNIFRVIVLGIALVVLIWLGLRKFGDKK